MTTCIICDTNPQEVGPRCRTCHAYLQRTGFDRPPHLARRQPDLNRRVIRRRGPRFRVV